MAKVTFGNRQAGILCNLPTERRLDLIAEGLPVILASAESFWTAAASLTQAPREARVLEGFAEEEAAKILILMDLVRCPPKLVASLSGKIVRTFYDHLGRLIYGDAQSWRPVDVAQLRDYVDNTRQGHYLEGYAGEYIVPNWSRYSREAAMYADIEVLDNGSAHWSEPLQFGSVRRPSEPAALMLGKAMAAVGMFTRAGLQAVAEVWGEVEFVDTQGYTEQEKLTQAMFERLDAAQVVTEAASADHVRLLRHYWQLPMYHLDFKEAAVPLETLQADREAQLWAEAGYGPEYG
ncbi:MULTISPECIES: hypothetical protein [Sphingomonadaceae]|jgi:hypothetical protein|uniref:Uncharacterized protein n=1 Tax=Sphingobium soli TaxID=1591116 RepID=A0ABS8H7A3_9SPHN|nr:MULTISPECIES: hypothetical protein [Sphingomonadaceae]MAP45151.1 hypothetical protein [Sphingobium sp.]MEA3388828.1 hypothetical protein [Pseudomonadota bacterium]EAT08503.1 hypothetical protein SKA58_18720 [Sphingomonas sp. SKA58]MAX16244.1 hypothetical protein [Sphingobium sp.]MBS46471.1 hypothetical protein [Sphingobium sp.]|tara:strand:- start:2721 stop:3596 length:876 start_codon:yes stop_codon:yes gene_type:complete